MRTYLLLVALALVFSLQDCTQNHSAPAPQKPEPTASPTTPENLTATGASENKKHIVNAPEPDAAPIMEKAEATPPPFDFSEPVNLKINLDFFQSKPNGKPWDGADPVAQEIASLIPGFPRLPLPVTPPDIKVFVLTDDEKVRPLKEFGLNSRHLLLQDVSLPESDFALFIADLDGDFKLTPGAWHDYIGAVILTASNNEITEPERVKWNRLLRRAMHAVGIQDFDHPAQIPGMHSLQIPDHFPEYSLGRCAESPCSLDDQENVATLQFLPSRRKQ